MSGVRVKTGHAQILGVRDEQQDAFGFNDMEDQDLVQHAGVLAVVADGIGGHAHGGEASRRAVEAFVNDYQGKPPDSSIPDALYHALRVANWAVLDFAESQGASNNCGTTLVAAVLHPETSSLHWIGAGDSRLYLLRGNSLVQFTMDGNYRHQLQRKVARGMIAREQMATEENAHMLTSFLGWKKFGRVDRSIRPFPLHEEDQVLLCTDGIYQTLLEAEIFPFLGGEPQQACDRLAQAVLDKKSEHQDNASIVVLAYGLKETPTKVFNITDNTVEKKPPTKQADAKETRKHSRIRLKILWAVAIVLTIVFAIWVVR